VIASIRTGLTAALTLVIAAAASAALAQTYPDRPVRIFVGFPPGGTADLVARVIGNGLSQRLGQPVVIENRPGSGANFAGDAVARSAPDGYTLLHGSDSIFIANPHIYARMPFNPLKDVVPVTSLLSSQYMFVVNPSVKANDLREFVELARKTKPPMFYASVGNGSLHHLGMEWFKQHVGIDLTHVPYRGGGPAGNGLMTGDVQVMFGAGAVLPMVKSGKVRALAVTGDSRYVSMPDLPTIKEIFPGFDVTVWHGLFVPAGTPQPIVEKLRTEVNAVLRDPEVAKRLVSSGAGEPYISDPNEFQARIRRDHEQYGKLIRSIGLEKIQ
jgi:tripartite-type tricarboxylate transporter receptor subunit TctC